MRKIVLLICVSLLTVTVIFSQKHIFSFNKTDFHLDGKPFQIISAEIHPGRVPQMYWHHRIQMAKAMGCNTIAVYVFWNYLEETPGVFDFKTENRNIAQFIKFCQEEGMWVLLRPGPYVCGEWDLGGLPSWLLKIPDIKLRCMDERYLIAVKRYVAALSKELKPLLCSNGGPILMVQVENEYGSYGNDRLYVKTLHDLWLKNGVDVPFYTADGATPHMLEAGSLPGCAIGLDSGTNDADFNEAIKCNPYVPVFSSETYPGWLTHWKEQFAKPDTANLLKEVRYLLENKKSVNFYVVHGGTNFGFWAGANAFSPTQYQPDLTSYDYDAPINEQGQPTPKYFALRKLISRYVSYKIPDVPKTPEAIEIPEFQLHLLTSVWNNLAKPILSAQPKPMEMFDQASGFVLYRTRLIGHKSGNLTITEPHDFALVLLNGQLVDTIYRDGGRWTIKLPKTDVKEPVLDILVEGMGRINFAQYMIDRKGITDRVTLNGMTLMNWEIFSLPMNEKYISGLQPNLQNIHDGVFFEAKFDIEKPADTYLDMSNYGKGVIWVNGHNLGRFWKVGPQQRLYCPASFLLKGENKVIVLDLLNAQPKPIKGVKTLE